MEKTGHDYFDFYLFHNVCELNIEQYLDPQYGIMDYLWEQKQAGRIKHLGFSCHGDVPVLKRFLEAYGERIEFCQLQLNYMDWEFQHGKQKVELLREYGIPVWVMEPVRGGQLAHLTDEAEAKLKALRPDENIPAWAFRFLQSIEGVTVTLSGMSTLEQVKENIATYDEAKPLNDEEMNVILGIADDMIKKTTVPCTACHYCVSHCPMSLDIPFLLKLYNEAMVAGAGDFIAPMALAALDQDKLPSACIGCGECAKVCPQTIDIPGTMKKFNELLGQ